MVVIAQLLSRNIVSRVDVTQQIRVTWSIHQLGRGRGESMARYGPTGLPSKQTTTLDIAKLDRTLVRND